MGVKHMTILGWSLMVLEFRCECPNGG